jgi:hypothetical protein
LVGLDGWKCQKQTLGPRLARPPHALPLVPRVFVQVQIAESQNVEFQIVEFQIVDITLPNLTYANLTHVGYHLTPVRSTYVHMQEDVSRGRMNSTFSVIFFGIMTFGNLNLDVVTLHLFRSLLLLHFDDRSIEKDLN